MENDSFYYAITGNSEAIYLGGYTEDTDLNLNYYDDGTVLTRIDLATFTVIW